MNCLMASGKALWKGLKFLFLALTSPLWGPFVAIHYCYNNPDEARESSASLGRLMCDVLSAPFVGCYIVASGCFTGCGESDAGRWLIANMAGLLGLFALLGEYLSGAKKRAVDVLSFLCLCASASALETPLLNTTDPLSIPFSALKDDGVVLGDGTFGTVFKGTWRKKPGEGDEAKDVTGVLCYKAVTKTVAIKKLKESRADLEEPFRHEVTIHASLEHDNIVKFFGACFEPGRYSLVMEYMENGSLYKVLQEQKNLPWLTKLSIAKNVADGLAFLHSKNIIHRDLKSLNVVLDLELRAKISDFGFSKFKPNHTTTNNATLIGTIAWMAPELIDGSAGYTEFSDVYALAIILWEIMTQEQPYLVKEVNGAPKKDEDGKFVMMSIVNIMRKVVDGTPPLRPTGPVATDTSPGFAALIPQAWAQQPGVRPKAAVIAVKLKDQHAALFRSQNPGYVGGVPVDSAYGLNSQV